jgi:hypothetical protein
MEGSVGSKKSVYGMLMTVLFYTTGFICGLRTVAWLVMHMLIPVVSRILALCYRRSSTSHSNPAPPSPGASGVGKSARDAAGLLFKLVHTAAGDDLLVPVPVPASIYHISAAVVERSSDPGRAFARLALFVFLIGACGIAAYCYFHCGPLARTWGSIARSISAALQRRQRHGPSNSGPAATKTDSGSGTGTPALTTTPTARCAKTKLNPAAPPFTPSPPSFPLPQLHRLDPTARTFAPRGCATPPSPTESVDSSGPATPSPSCMLRTGSRMGKSGTGGGAGLHIPVGVGKMRVVRPEEVVVGDRRAGEVFVFF